MLPEKLNLVQEAKDVGVLQAPGTFITDNRWGIASNGGIVFESLPAIFSGTSVTPTAEQTIFVQLDGFATAVPVAVARTVQQDFISGFVARLLLDAYVLAAKQPGHGGYAGLATLNLSLNGKFSANQQDFAQFSSPSTYSGMGVSDLQSAIAISQATQPIISYGLLLGWSAADDLLKTDLANGNSKLQKDFWSLLNYRYEFSEIGFMTAFTLDYLGGEAMSTRIVSLLPSSTSPPYPVLTPGNSASSAAAYAHALLQNVATKSTTEGTNDFAVTFGNVMETEFYAVSRSNINNKKKQLLMTRYMNVLQGYRRGVNEATNLVYSDLTGEVFTIAYADGFQAGYTLGYVAGWKDGYAAGNLAAWQQANAIIASLQSQISSLQQQLDNANADSGGNFWDNAGGILNDVGTAVGIIGSLF
jgi:hypothetical protein